ncbi:flagellar basal body P-ring protein FlgI [Candidatus Sumerlaeota bacterium]|nr:flagellar basal body P-ring protein FlgI [Candidatus Sumerlaeota bacterium]
MTAHSQGTGGRSGSLAALIAATAALAALLAQPAGAVRIKDVAAWEGVRDNQLLGYGLVVGLTDTGDSDADFTAQSIAAWLRRQGVNVDPDDLETGNVAAVAVTATLPPFARPGQTIDIQISSLGDAESLYGGTLLQTPLEGADGRIYAVAQGPIALGGFEASAGASSVSRNHLTSARVANGALLERPSPVTLEGRDEINLLLNNPDFTTAQRIANAINHFAGDGVAEAIDAMCVSVDLPAAEGDAQVNFLAEVERIEVSPDSRALIILNERTGTIIFTEDVRISTFAITHGNLTITTTQQTFVSQPAPFSQTGETVAYTEDSVTTELEDRPMAVIHEGVTLSELVNALNALGVSPRDLVAILQAIEAAGALQADLEVI